jgi:hypothetical protein
VPIILIDRSAPDFDLAGLPDTSHWRGSTSEAANGGFRTDCRILAGVQQATIVLSVGPDFECVTPVNSLWDRRRAAMRTMRSGVSGIAPRPSVRWRMFALDVAVDAPIEFGASRSSPGKICATIHRRNARAR